MNRIGLGKPIELYRRLKGTILGGVEELVTARKYPLAALVFCASILVPVLKLVGLSVMLITIGRGATPRRRDRPLTAVGVLSCAAGSAPAQPFHFLERTRPVFAQQARQYAVGEEPPTGLAARTVVRLVVRVDNPRDRRPASRARFSVPSVDRHAFVKGGHFLGEAFAGFAPKSLGPFKERPLRCVE